MLQLPNSTSKRQILFYVILFILENATHRVVYDRSELFTIEELDLVSGSIHWHGEVDAQAAFRQAQPVSPDSIVERIIEIYPRFTKSFGIGGSSHFCVNKTYLHLVKLDQTCHEILA